VLGKGYEVLSEPRWCIRNWVQRSNLCRQDFILDDIDIDCV